jgi:ubiquitin C-terminal hydrolase
MMAKAKKFNPAEEYKSRKAREELEKNALLPPGLINHANTCFFNSTLQAVSARYLIY